jgi:RNA polymerase sigma-70 factor (ECF subfamily)
MTTVYHILSDDGLVERIGQQDRAAFDALLARHLDYFYKVAYRIVLQQQDAEDIAQEAFLKLWTGKAQWKKQNATFRTWFYRIVVNQALDLLRVKHPTTAEDAAPEASHDETAELFLEAAETKDAITQAVAALPNTQRAAVMLFYMDEIPQKDAAQILGLSLKAFESLLSRAKVQLKTIMEERYEHAG